MGEGEGDRGGGGGSTPACARLGLRVSVKYSVQALCFMCG